MIIDLDTLSPSQTYFSMIQTLVPRPIAWVLSENPAGDFNLAPFSYFSAVSSNPPLVMISIGRKPSGEFKDTKVNIEERRDFVIHIVHREMLEAMNASSATLPLGDSEVSRLGLATIAMEGSRLPRLVNCKIAYACSCYQMVQVGPDPQTLVIGRVNTIYVDDDVLDVNEKDRIKVNTKRLDPLGRLGASEYLSAGEVISLKRPL